MRLTLRLMVLGLALGTSWAPSTAHAQLRDVPAEAYQGMKWRNIGPFRGGRSVAVAGTAHDYRVYYFGGVGSGVWKTTDAGLTWKNVSDQTFGTASVGAVSVAPSDPNVVYVGMGEHAVRGVMTSHGDGVYRSTDQGKTWAHLGLEGTRHISAIEVHPKDPDVVYVAAQGALYGPSEERGVYRSTDGGRSWQRVLFVNRNTGVSSLSLDPDNPRILFAGTWDHQRSPWEIRSGGPGSGIYRTKDGGDTWERLDRGFPELMGKTAVSIAANSDRVYALVEADPGGGLFRSDDGGDSWKLVNDNWSLRARAWYYIHVHADPQDPNVVWVLNARVHKSVDGGENFERVSTPHGDNHGIWINPENSQYVINANDGGANVSLNGGQTWSTQRNQPTAQFYRVNVDNRFPYYVYGGQQDNTSVAIASRAPGGGIGWKDWYAAAGCETAYLAFDPDRPERNYGGCYLGQIAEYDAKTQTQRNVMAYPLLPAALPSRVMKYRFNWNAPILVSQHDPRVIYHAANMVLRSDDRGQTWTEISPDLTRDEAAKQGPGGRPITNEGAGGEIYNTILYLIESPHDAGTLWAGSDDGLIHLTRDGGVNWIDVTPDDLPEGMVNSIEVSPHDSATAYVAFTRYKFNDLSPHVYRTTDFGRSWDHVADGIDANAFVRVVREDPRRSGLLYAGTETGLYVSWDRGEHWQSLQLNMPVTPITDLKVQARDNDLVAATGGRGFWILDDLSPLQQWSGSPEEGGIALASPRVAYRMAGGRPPSNNPTLGRNPPYGAIVDFWIDGADSVPVMLEVVNAGGELIRTFTSAPKSARDSSDMLKLKAGHNRVAWDLRHEPVPGVPGKYVFGSLRGGKVVPGEYRVRLVRGDQSWVRSFQVVQDPRVEAGLDGFREQASLMEQVTGDLTEIHETVIEVRELAEQLRGLLDRLPEEERYRSLSEQGEQLIASLFALEDSLVQKRVVDGQTVINFPPRLAFHFTYLRGVVDGSEGQVTEGSKMLYRELAAQWAEHRAVRDRLFEVELPAFNAAVEDLGVPAVIVGDGTP